MNEEFGSSGYLYFIPTKFYVDMPRAYGKIESIGVCDHVSHTRSLFFRGIWWNVCKSCGMINAFENVWEDLNQELWK